MTDGAGLSAGVRVGGVPLRVSLRVGCGPDPGLGQIRSRDLLPLFFLLLFLFF
jgi:hypothetical protein